MEEIKSKIIDIFRNYKEENELTCVNKLVALGLNEEDARGLYKKGHEKYEEFRLIVSENIDYSKPNAADDWVRRHDEADKEFNKVVDEARSIISAKAKENAALDNGDINAVVEKIRDKMQKLKEKQDQLAALQNEINELTKSIQEDLGVGVKW